MYPPYLPLHWSPSNELRGRFAPPPRWLSALPYLLGFGALAWISAFGYHEWMVNDDVGMAMVTGGYGASAVSSPALVYSSVLWGRFIQLLPPLSGVQSYGLATYLALLASAAAVLAALRRARAPSLLAAGVALAVFYNPLIEPQFTVVSGCLTTAGVTLLLAYRERLPWPVWLAAGLLLFAGYLVRRQEFYFILILGLPFYGSMLLENRGKSLYLGWLTLACVLAAAIATAVLLDQAYYSTPEWTAFWRFDKLRQYFSDYGYATYALQHPAVLAGTGLSQLDMEMFRMWFFQDGRVFTPEHLQAVLDNINRVPLDERFAENLQRWGVSLQLLKDPLIELYLLIIGYLLVLHKPRRPLLLSVALLFGVLATFCLMGRPGIPRAYYAAFACLPLFALASTRGVARLYSRHWLALVPAALLAWTLHFVFTGVQGNDRWGQYRVHINEQLCAVPKAPLVVVWGQGLPLAPYYHPLDRIAKLCPLQIYWIDPFGMAPFDTAQLKQATGTADFTQALLAGQHFYSFAPSDALPTFAAYLMQHYGRQLVIRDVPFWPLALYDISVKPPRSPATSKSARRLSR